MRLRPEAWTSDVLFPAQAKLVIGLTRIDGEIQSVDHDHSQNDGPEVRLLLLSNTLSEVELPLTFS